MRRVQTINVTCIYKYFQLYVTQTSHVLKCKGNAETDLIGSDVAALPSNGNNFVKLQHVVFLHSNGAWLIINKNT